MSAQVDVVIVGAGPVGILVQQKLREHGVNTLLVHAGKRLSLNSPPKLCDESIWGYKHNGRLHEWPRIHAIGGKTTVWGGYLYRFPEKVFRDGRWPYSNKTLLPFYREVEHRLPIVLGKLNRIHTAALRKLGLPVLPLRAARTDCRVWNAADMIGMASNVKDDCIAISLEQLNHCARWLTVSDTEGYLSNISAKAFVLAASPLESTRILMNSGIDKLGQRLADHPTVGFMLIEAKPVQHRLSPYMLLDGALVPNFVNRNENHKRSYIGGFSTEIIGPYPVTSLPKSALDILGTQFSDMKRCRVTYINAMGEAIVHRHSHIKLSKEKDVLGRAKLEINLHNTRDDNALIKDMKSTCLRIADAIASPGSELYPISHPNNHRVLFHEAGTCVMGTGDEPCDIWGRLRATRNVWLADASVFPSAGDRHPTLTVLAHALRVAQNVIKTLKN